jgi:hypothetical protein
LANSGAWDFKASAANPWYRSKRVLTAAGGAAVAALVLAGVLLLLRGSAAGVQETSVSPTNPPVPSRHRRAPRPPCPRLSLHRHHCFHRHRRQPLPSRSPRRPRLACTRPVDPRHPSRTRPR